MLPLGCCAAWRSKRASQQPVDMDRLQLAAHQLHATLSIRMHCFILPNNLHPNYHCTWSRRSLNSNSSARRCSSSMGRLICTGRGMSKELPPTCTPRHQVTDETLHTV